MRANGVLWVAGFGYVTALVAAALAAFVFARGGGPSLAWALLGTSAALAVVAYRFHETHTELSERLSQRVGQIDLLQSELNAQRNAVDALADGLDVAIFICDPRASILYANRRAMELFRFENPIGRSVLAVTLSHEVEQLVLAASAHREPQSAEIVFPYPDERVGLAKSWVPSEDEPRVFLSVYEITSLRRLERVRQDFVANVSHELRTPLTIIRAMAETLLEDVPPSDETGTKYLSKIISEVDRLSTISQDLLILSAAESNPVRKHACDVADVFRNVLAQLESKGAKKGLEMEYVGPEHCMIAANTSQMTQVALNLVDNAINYSLGGTVSVVLRVEGDEARIEVRDQGIGISSEHLPRIFERFYRVDKARSRSSGGTGLGLSIVKHIVEAHGGTVSATSELNRGSTFTVLLPMGEPEATRPGAA